jgi:hypothetical protein
LDGQDKANQATHRATLACVSDTRVSFHYQQIKGSAAVASPDRGRGGRNCDQTSLLACFRARAHTDAGREGKLPQASGLPAALVRRHSHLLLAEWVGTSTCVGQPNRPLLSHAPLRSCPSV